MIRLPPFAPQICEYAHHVTRLVFLVLPGAYSQDPCTDFHDVPFGGRKDQILLLDPIFPEKCKILANFRQDRKFRVRKALTMGMLPCKLPLIVIVAQ